MSGNVCMYARWNLDTCTRSSSVVLTLTIEGGDCLATNESWKYLFSDNIEPDTTIISRILVLARIHTTIQSRFIPYLFILYITSDYNSLIFWMKILKVNLLNRCIILYLASCILISTNLVRYTVLTSGVRSPMITREVIYRLRTVKVHRVSGVSLPARIICSFSATFECDALNAS